MLTADTRHKAETTKLIGRFSSSNFGLALGMQIKKTMTAFFVYNLEINKSASCEALINAESKNRTRRRQNI